jgi:hypothetical protein
MLDIHAEAGFGQVGDVTLGREHVHLAGEQLADGPRLGRRLDNQQILPRPRPSGVLTSGF